MDNTTIMSEEELKDVLSSIYDNAKSGKMKFDQIQELYGIHEFAISDLKSMSQKEFCDFLNSISNIKKDIQEGKRTRKISAEIGCGTSIISFIAKHTCEGYTQNRKYIHPEYEVLCKKIEKCWKEHRSGETIEVLSVKYNMDYIELEKLLNSFDNLVEKKRKHYKDVMNPNEVKEESKKLKEKWYLDYDTIGYIVEGKEIKKIKEEEGVSLDEP